MDSNRTDGRQAETGEAISLAERFVASGRFKLLFAEGMQLVEETASYLDGDGREAAKVLPRKASGLYASESMRLTTRLMQLASWLLLQRAASEGEMTREQILDEKRKMRLEILSGSAGASGRERLPEAFVELVRRADALQARVISLDSEIYGTTARSLPESRDNPVTQRIELLSTAFGARRG